MKRIVTASAIALAASLVTAGCAVFSTVVGPDVSKSAPQIPTAPTISPTLVTQTPNPAPVPTPAAAPAPLPPPPRARTIPSPPTGSAGRASPAIRARSTSTPPS